MTASHEWFRRFSVTRRSIWCTGNVRVALKQASILGCQLCTDLEGRIINLKRLEPQRLSKSSGEDSGSYHSSSWQLPSSCLVGGKPCLKSAVANRAYLRRRGPAMARNESMRKQWLLPRILGEDLLSAQRSAALARISVCTHVMLRGSNCCFSTATTTRGPPE